MSIINEVAINAMFEFNYDLSILIAINVVYILTQIQIKTLQFELSRHLKIQ